MLLATEVNKEASALRVMTEDEIKRITICQKTFIDLIPTERIVEKLIEEEIITSRHKSLIICKDSPIQKNRKLLEILKRRSFQDIVKFCVVLQQHEELADLAKIIKGEGGIDMFQLYRNMNIYKPYLLVKTNI